MNNLKKNYKMKWIVIITTAFFYTDLFFIYKMYNIIVWPLLVAGTVAVGLILLSTLIFEEQI
jgi:putative effector of murein hydrolase